MIDKLKNRFVTGAWLTDVKHYFSKINEIIDYLNQPSYGLPYNSYVSLIVQSGTSVPIVEELQNNISTPVTIERYGAGGYRFVSDSFVLGKVYISGFSDFAGDGNAAITLFDESAIIGYLQISVNQAEGRVNFDTWDATFTRVDFSDILGTSKLCFPEIRVYN